jgi:hypothetical protein
MTSIIAAPRRRLMTCSWYSTLSAADADDARRPVGSQYGGLAVRHVLARYGAAWNCH